MPSTALPRPALFALLILASTAAACSDDPTAPVEPAQLTLSVRNGAVLDLDGVRTPGVHLEAAFLGVDQGTGERAAAALESLEVRLPDGSSVVLPVELQRWRGFRSGLFVETDGPAPEGEYELTARFDNGSRLHVVRDYGGAELINMAVLSEVAWEGDNATIRFTAPLGTVLWAVDLYRLSGSDMERVATGVRGGYPAPATATGPQQATYVVDRDPSATYVFTIDVVGADSYRRDPFPVPAS